MDDTLQGQPAPSQDQTIQDSSSTPSFSERSIQQQSKDQALFDLAKADKFSFEGREWTRDAFKKLIDQEKQFQSMNEVYTTKTQKLAEDRKAVEENRKYYTNLAADLIKVKENPSLASEFVRVYPQEFHQYVEQFLRGGQQQTQGQPQGPNVDVNMLSRLDRLEKFYNEQEIARNESEITKLVDDLSKKYPEAAEFKEMCLGRAYEAHLAGEKLTPESWEKIFKDVEEQVSGVMKAKYGNLVNKQTEANARGKSPQAGGGASGSAPRKFKSFREASEALIQDVTRSG
jgi:hypothetical protein